MNNIQLLPESLRNQIAAGEVVERPASIIKELVENSIDAGATNIVVNLVNAGIDSIEIKDNGQGINQADLMLAITRHATSKINKKEDLFNINTLGFRGEALASMASVSLFSIASKTENDLAGSKIEVHAGYTQDQQNFSMNTGTIVEVKDLFLNIPARKKFLKTINVELKHCVDTMENFAFCYPEINFTLSHNDKNVFKVTPTAFKARIEEIVSDEVKNSLIPIYYDADIMQIKGFVSKPGVEFKTRNNQKIFVNNRSIKDTVIAGAVNQAYYSFLDKGAFPAYYLFITVPPDLIDVNVHPAKSEVRFMRSQEVFQGVKNAIINSFSKQEVPLIEPNKISNDNFNNNGDAPILSWSKPNNNTTNLNNFNRNSNYNFANKPTQSQVQSALDFSKTFLNNSINKYNSSSLSDIGDKPLYLDFQITDELQGYKIIGQVLRKFILLEKNEQIIFLDQHAVHERLRYDKLKQDFKDKKINSQKLLLPEIIKCQFNEFINIKEHELFLQQIGFELSEFGVNTWQILAIPSQIDVDNLKEIILKICDELGETYNSTEINANTEKALIYLSCRGAVKFGDNLNTNEIEALVKNWLKYAKNLTCPHGRILSWIVNSQEIEKKMGR